MLTQIGGEIWRVGPLQDVGEYVSTDLRVFKNQAARDGTCYVQIFTDHASKFVTVFVGLKKQNEAINNLEKYICVDSFKLG